MTMSTKTSGPRRGLGPHLEIIIIIINHNKNNNHK